MTQPVAEYPVHCHRLIRAGESFPIVSLISHGSRVPATCQPLASSNQTFHRFDLGTSPEFSAHYSGCLKLPDEY